MSLEFIRCEKPLLNPLMRSLSGIPGWCGTVSVRSIAV